MTAHPPTAPAGGTSHPETPAFVVYQASKVGEAYWWYRARQEMVADVFRHYLPARLAARDLCSLDIGCGAGGTVELLRTWGEAWGVDPESDALALAQERGLSSACLVQAPMEALTPFDANRFDVITCLDVLEHVVDPKAALAEMFRVLKPGGRALLSVPADPRLWSDRDLRLHHRLRYTPAALREELIAAGFEVVRATYTNSFYYWPFRAWLAWQRLTHVQTVPHVQRDTFETNVFFSSLWRGLLRLETAWWLRHPLPWGVSAVSVVRKPQ